LIFRGFPSTPLEDFVQAFISEEFHILPEKICPGRYKHGFEVKVIKFTVNDI